MEWYPQDKEELNLVLDKFLNNKQLKKIKQIHGIIVPHAGYDYSGSITGKAFSFLKNSKFERAVVFGPSHRVGFNGISVLSSIKTPLGEVDIIKEDIKQITGLNYEHSVDNQIPFLQKIGINKITPIVVGNLNEKEAEKIAEHFSKIKNAVFVFSTDLSHFLPYNEAEKKDNQTIKIIEKLDIKNINKIDACGTYPLLILMNLCKIKSWKPHLIEYKNSGDITKDKSSVVGYSSFWF